MAMKKLTVLWFFCLFTFAFCLASYAGQWTAHGYFYKPSMGASGQTEYNLFNQGLDQADAELFALDPPPGLVATPPLTYNAANGVISLPPASARVSGYLASGDWSAFNAKEPAISLGTSLQYWRGDKTWQTLNPAAVGAAPATAGTSILKGNGSGGTTAAVSNTDYAAVRDNGDPTYLWNGNKLLSRISDVWASITGGNLIVWGSNIYGTNLATIISTIGNSTPANLIVPTGTFAISANTTVTSNIRLLPHNGANISIPTGVTLTINGPFEAGSYQVFSYTGTGRVVFGPGSVKQLVPQWWGAKGDGINNDQPALQAMANAGGASGGIAMIPPNGRYKILDTFNIYWNNPSSFASCYFGGAGSCRGDQSQGVIIDATAFGDRPAINVQGCWGAVLENFQVVGKNVAPATAAAYPNILPTRSSWVTSGCNDTRYSPYAGICLDGYSGTKPTGGYNNLPYNTGTGATTSMSTTIRKVNVTGFVVGICNNPSAMESDSVNLSLYDVNLRYNTFGFSSGASQSRCQNAYGLNCEGNWCAITTIRHGGQDGNALAVFGGDIYSGYKVAEYGGGNAWGLFENVHSESMCYLGEFGPTNALGSTPHTFRNCNITFMEDGNSYIAPYKFELQQDSTVIFDGCRFQPETSSNQARIFNYLGAGNVVFDNCRWANIPTTSMAIGVQCNNLGGTAAFQSQLAINTYMGIGSSAYNGFWLDRELNFATVPARQGIGYGTIRINTPSGSYHVNRLTEPGNSADGCFQLYISGLSLTGTGHGATLTFTVGDTADVALGDLICWNVIEPVTGYNYNSVMPIFYVSNINGGTGVVTATALYDGFDATYAPTSLQVVVPFFINGAPSTCTMTNGGYSLTNVTNIANFQVRDFITGANFNTGNPTRVTAIDSGAATISISRPTTANASGVNIYNCGLTAY
jgi:hypothetical protein